MKLAARDFTPRLQQEGVPAVMLLYGQDQGLVARYAMMVRRAVVSVEDEEMDAASHHGADLDVSRFLSGCNAFPFFARRRFILLKEADQLAAAARDAVLNYVKSPARHTVLVVLAGPLDVKHPVRKLFEGHASGWCIPCFPLEGRELAQWIRTTLRGAGFSVDEEAVAVLGERLEGDARNAESELEKLIVFLGERRRVTLEDVLASVGSTGNQNGFAWAAALFAGRTGLALTILDGLLDGGEEPLVLLGLLTQRLRRLIQGGAGLAQGESPDAVAAALQIFWKEKSEFLNQARSMSTRRLADGLLRCQEADRELKSGGEPRRVMERLVLGLARLLNPTPASGGDSGRTAGPQPSVPRQ
ncbi:MAG: DNA polymerase III subunit delta [Magnetococcales bacterium]|nr:DNA polymerase III subunit delta [Magnetococcales bacterium]